MLVIYRFGVHPVLHLFELVGLWKVVGGEKTETHHVIAEHEHFPKSAPVWLTLNTWMDYPTIYITFTAPSAEAHITVLGYQSFRGFLQKSKFNPLPKLQLFLVVVGDNFS
jgi:hypothetical protein